ncbi:MAG: 3-phosphoserine/phosphohydroxythreonine transaminase [Clostridiales bacterium]|nr:3-phosphoserine/phosphohydroxythreonine transaminase [Clostridiales bacterium]
MEQVYNFSAGPSMLPKEVLEKAQKEMLNYGDTGQSIMEMSHRSKEYYEIHNEAKKIFCEIMNIPNNYKVLMLQGGGSLQFSMVPMNLFKNGCADYAVTGYWADKAAIEAKKHLKVNRVLGSEDKKFSYIPKFDKSALSKDADYFHITTNNTIYGTRYIEIPITEEIPLVADMSSNILSESYDVSKFGLIYAAAQKNMGTSGVTFVIINENLIEKSLDFLPSAMSYETHSKNDSIYNTPPTYSIYISMLVCKWIKNNGGVEHINKLNEEKAKILYDCLDESKIFYGTAEKKFRSIMNVVFLSKSKEIDEKFISEAYKEGLINLKGHKSIGGMRASIYNAMPIEGIKKLVKFMKNFEYENKSI